ncbi:uncharacterized protein [Miscanthus floridulus]|uniref:uncharacterized protein isoform X2 n=1 Tax=Miscanthus floridulus TaxID=154761 RepID=UPI0034598DFF
MRRSSSAPSTSPATSTQQKKYRSGVLYWVLELEEPSAWLQLGRGRRGMGSLLCCLRYPEDGSAAPPVCCFCLPWPFPYHGVDSGSAARHRGDTRVAPDCGRIPLAACTSANQVDSLDTFRPPPWPLPYNDPQFSARMVQHPTVSGHDKASTHIQKPEQPTESKNADAGSTCTAHKVSETSAKQHSGGSRIDGIQFCDSSDNEDDCPICLEDYVVQ